VDRKRIGVVGVSGFLGRKLATVAASRGHSVIGFSRNIMQVEGCKEMRVFRADGPLPVHGLDAIVNLAGESILGRWTPAKRRTILESRIMPTRRLVAAIAAERETAPTPEVLVNASGIGYYGNTGDETVDERSPRGTGFLAETCGLWESEAVEARRAGLRVVLLRTGFVLGREGGAMPLVGRVFRMGLGGRFGNGRQYMPWVHVDDVVRIILYAAENSHVDGPLNAVSPAPVTNREFTKAVARTVGRPAVFPAPAFVLRPLLGEFSGTLLDSVRAVSRDLAGFPYRYQTLDPALADVLRKKAS
jgi:uncharacterized protein (TIGR01777 family)